MKISQERLFAGLLTAAVVLCIVDFFYHKHTHFDLEKIPLFYPLFGFGVCWGLLWVSRKVQSYIQREEDYYDR